MNPTNIMAHDTNGCNCVILFFLNIYWGEKEREVREQEELIQEARQKQKGGRRRRRRRNRKRRAAIKRDSDLRLNLILFIYLFLCDKSRTSKLSLETSRNFLNKILPSKDLVKNYFFLLLNYF